MELYCQECKKYHELDQAQVQKIIDYAQELILDLECIEDVAWRPVEDVVPAFSCIDDDEDDDDDGDDDIDGSHFR